MNPENWSRLESVQRYLQSRKEAGINACKALMQQLDKDECKLAVITFTYEHLEVLGKKGDGYMLYDSLANTINRYELEELIDYDYNDENKLEEFLYDELSNLKDKLIKLWIVTCVDESEILKNRKLELYFKDNHDDLEVLELHTCETKFEASEFETYVSNNKRNIINLIPSG